MPALRILVTGATGFLAGHAVRALVAGGHRVLTTSKSGGDAAFDLASPGSVDALLRSATPDLVLILAAMARITECGKHPERARAVNAEAPGLLAQRLGARLLHVSTDLVFDGRSAPYSEASAVGPLSVYGATKAEGEELVRAHAGRVVRVPLLFGPDDHGRGASASLREAIHAGRACPMFTNEYRTPLHAADAAAALAHLIVDPDGPVLLHLPGPERCSRWEFARRLCARQGLDAGRLVPVECQDAQRPRDVSLAGAWRAARSLDEMLAQ
jgi:dTDP-4-dehydrorhamnose reductase